MMISELQLPNEWHTLLCQDKNSNNLYGLYVNSSTNSYIAYVTDLKEVWMETSTSSQTREKSKSYGILLDTAAKISNLNYILAGIIDEESADINLKHDSNNSKHAWLQLTKRYVDGSTFNWEFGLEKVDESFAVRVLQKITFQLFSQVNYAEYQKHSLIKELKKKDLIVLFLLENLRDLGAEKLLEQFVRNHGGESCDIFEKFNTEQWSENVSGFYQNLLATNNKNYIWQFIKDCTSRNIDWKFSNSYCEEYEENQEIDNQGANQLRPITDDFLPIGSERGDNQRGVCQNESRISEFEKESATCVKSSNGELKIAGNDFSASGVKASSQSEGATADGSEIKSKRKIGLISSRKRRIAPVTYSSPIKAPRLG